MPSGFVNAAILRPRILPQALWLVQEGAGGIQEPPAGQYLNAAVDRKQPEKKKKSNKTEEHDLAGAGSSEDFDELSGIGYQNRHKPRDTEAKEKKGGHERADYDIHDTGAFSIIHDVPLSTRPPSPPRYR